MGSWEMRHIDELNKKQASLEKRVAELEKKAARTITPRPLPYASSSFPNKIKKPKNSVQTFLKKCQIMLSVDYMMVLKLKR